MQNRISLSKITLLILLVIFYSCAQKSAPENGKVGRSEKVKKELKGSELKIVIPKADIAELEMEVNNGGFNQYFVNSGQNCYETLRELKNNGKVATAKLLQSAIELINPHHIPEKEFVEKLQKRAVEELYDHKINIELNRLDLKFYEYKDGKLTAE